MRIVCSLKLNRSTLSLRRRSHVANGDHIRSIVQAASSVIRQSMHWQEQRGCAWPRMHANSLCRPCMVASASNADRELHVELTEDSPGQDVISATDQRPSMASVQTSRASDSRVFKVPCSHPPPLTTMLLSTLIMAYTLPETTLVSRPVSYNCTAYEHASPFG